VSLRPLKLPAALGQYVTAFRVRVDVATKRGKVPMVVDVFAIGRGRTEITLDATLPLTSVPSLHPNELVWARMLVSRAVV
jgi:hypothetical protein